MVNGKLAKHTRTYHLDATTTPDELCGENEKRVCIMVYNNGSAIVYILGSKTTNYVDGIPVAPGGVYKNDTSYAQLWQVAASGSQNLRCQEDTD